MLPSQYLQNCRLPCAVGSDEEAAIAGVESEREVVNEGGGARRRVAVDSGVGEAEIVDLDRWIRILLHRHCVCV